MITRRALAAGGALALAGCSRPRPPPMPRLTHRLLASLPTTTLPWLSLRDHFVATVGAHAGEGQPLGPLLVLADATFAPRSRFPLHPHRDMDILSVVIDGTLSHHGDQAHGAALGPRSAQLISARDGMRHAEGNDTDQPTRMLQLWFRPRAHGGPPVYFSRQLAGDARQIVAGDEGMPLSADARVWWLPLAAGKPEALTVAPARQGYLLALTTPLRAAGASLAVGEGAEVGEGSLEITPETSGAALWIDIGLA